MIQHQVILEHPSFLPRSGNTFMIASLLGGPPRSEVIYVSFPSHHLLLGWPTTRHYKTANSSG